MKNDWNNADMRHYNRFFRKYPAYRQQISLGRWRFTPQDLLLEKKRKKSALQELLLPLQGDVAMFSIPGESVDGMYLRLRFEATREGDFQEELIVAARRLHGRLSGFEGYAERIMALTGRKTRFLDELLRSLVTEAMIVMAERLFPISGKEKRMSSMPHLRGDAPHQVISAALTFIFDNVHRKLDAAEVAKHLGMSLNHLTAILRGDMGCGVLRIIWMSKCYRAATLLQNSDKSVKMIAAETGMMSLNYFCNRFRHFSGMTPLEFRRKSRGGEISPELFWINPSAVDDVQKRS